MPILKHLRPMVEIFSGPEKDNDIHGFIWDILALTAEKLKVMPLLWIESRNMIGPATN
jgi:hypothetical protein